MRPNAIRYPLVSLLFGLVATAPMPASAQPLPDTDNPAETRPADDSAEPAPKAQNYDARFQSTYVWQRHLSFAARYSGDNSLGPQREGRSYTLTGTAYLGARLWRGGEAYFDPEMISSQSLSDLHGLGGLTNGENQKGGGGKPTFYRARIFLRQTWGLGGGQEAVESAPNQLAGVVDKDRIVLTVGNLSVIDIFDNNAYSHDPRTQFLNWTLMTYGAYDYAADARGYSWGAAIEYDHGPWAFRFGRFEQPIESNGLALDSRIMAHYGDQVEVEHGHEIAGRPGKVRVLLFHNHARMGAFQDALDAWRAGGGVGVPDVGTVRKERDKYGWGVNLEQALSPDVGLFLRASANDGRSETYAFTEVERSLSGGISVKGTRWGRSGDTFGLGWVRNEVSAAHREYLANGGLGAFIGDGPPPAGTSFRYGSEQIIEAYYSAPVAKGAWISLDYQRIANPAYNAERGPVNVLGMRGHIEF